ncbi:MAG: DUF58 domain-containing protein [Betaproteobacteria bacterium]|nr:DUF58 domain-containing protein [Betaproteobacteria bacterium]
MSKALRFAARLTTWFYAAKAPERGPITLGHRRVYILPTRLGVMFAITLLIMLVGSINYVLSLGFMLTFLLAGMGLAGMVHTVRNLARLVIAIGRAEPVFAGEAAQFRLFVENAAPWARPAVMLRHDASGSQTVTDVPATGSADIVLPVPSVRRGWLHLTRVTLETRYPLGLFRAWSHVQPDFRCLVYPRPEMATLPPSSPDASTGARQATAHGTDDFSGLRGYQLADSPRHVAWKAVARNDAMLTKQFTGDASAELWLDWAHVPTALELEAKLSRLAGWVLAAETAGLRYGLRLPGTDISPGHGEPHRSACLTALALYAT